MKMLVEKLVDGKQEFEVVEGAENASEAINQCSLNFFIGEKENVVTESKEVAYIGVYEVGQTNLLEHTEDIANVHRVYHDKLVELGINPLTFEKE